MNEHSFIVKDEAILDAALDLFGKRGYGNTPVPRVAQRAGVAVGTIYRYFPGKEGVVNALYRHWKRIFAERIVAGVDLEGRPEEVFRRMWAHLATFARQHADAFAFLETHYHAAYLDAESRALTAAIDARLVSLLRRWQEQGAVREGDPELLLAQVFGGFVGVIRQLRTDGRPIPAEIGAMTVDQAWQSLAVPSASSRGELL